MDWIDSMFYLNYAATLAMKIGIPNVSTTMDESDDVITSVRGLTSSFEAFAMMIVSEFSRHSDLHLIESATGRQALYHQDQGIELFLQVSSAQFTYQRHYLEDIPQRPTARQIYQQSRELPLGCV